MELKLLDGNTLPHIGLGTWPMRDAEVANVVAEAIDIGYRLFDTAVNYDNEAGVAEGIRRNGIAREDVTVTTKVPGRDHGYESAKQSLDGSLQRMQFDYVDLLLIHWPNPNDDQYVDTWRAFVDLQKEGKVRSIGVSNFTPAHIERIVDVTGVLPSVNQVQLYPAMTRPVERKFHEERGIITESWSPLGLGANVKYYDGKRTFLDSPVIREISDAHGKSPAQVVLRGHVQQGLLPLPKSSNSQRLAQNLDVFSFSLTDTEMARLSTLDDSSASPADSDEHHEY